MAVFLPSYLILMELIPIFSVGRIVLFEYSMDLILMPFPQNMAASFEDVKIKFTIIGIFIPLIFITNYTVPCASVLSSLYTIDFMSGKPTSKARISVPS